MRVRSSTGRIAIPRSRVFLVLLVIVLPILLVGLLVQPANAAPITYYLSSTAVTGNLNSLVTTTGTASRATTQTIGRTAGNFMVVPESTSSATGTPSTSTPSGYGWEVNLAGGVSPVAPGLLP